jgi:hypothetical protein
MSAEPVEGWHRGDWMQTFTGKRFYPLDPRPEDIDPIDVAHALSLLCRYNGHVDRFYSVAEHCVLMSQAVPEQDALEALLHDASEAYVGDMVRPLKHTPELTPYRVAEDQVEYAVWERFGLPFYSFPSGRGPSPRQPFKSNVVRDADTRILLTERTALMSNYKPSDRWLMDGMEPLDVTIHAWEPRYAELQYLGRLQELGVEVSS